MKISFPFLLFLILFGCKPEERAEYQSNPPISELEMVWKTPFATIDLGEGRTPIIYGDKVLFTGKPKYEHSSTFCFDAATGDTLWLKKDYIGRIPYESHQFAQNGKYVINGGGETWVFDIGTGEVDWNADNEYADWNFNVLNGNIYQVLRSEKSPPTFHRLMKTTLESSQWEEELVLYQDSLNGLHPDIVGPSLWQSPKGEMMLIFMNRGYTQSKARVDLYAYNLVTQKVDLKVLGIDSNMVSPIAPLIDQNMAYIKGKNHISCIDLIVGEIKWRGAFSGLDGNMEGSNLTVNGNNLLVHQGEALYSFNKYSGNLTWRNASIGVNPSNLKLHDEVVYYTTREHQTLHGISAINGKEILRMSSPHKNTYDHYTGAGFEQGVDIAGELDYLYVQDGYFLICYKLPDYE